LLIYVYDSAKLYCMHVFIAYPLFSDLLMFVGRQKKVCTNNIQKCDWSTLRCSHYEYYVLW